MSGKLKKAKAQKKTSKKGFNLWIDMVDPSTSDLSNIQQSFDLDNKTVETL
jgi:Mg2+ and Co2+ transporter CorA